MQKVLSPTSLFLIFFNNQVRIHLPGAFSHRDHLVVSFCFLYLLNLRLSPAFSLPPRSSPTETVPGQGNDSQLRTQGSLLEGEHMYLNENQPFQVMPNTLLAIHCFNLKAKKTQALILCLLSTRCSWRSRTQTQGKRQSPESEKCIVVGEREWSQQYLNLL